MNMRLYAVHDNPGHDHPRLAGLYPGWRVERLDVAKSMVNSGMRGETGASKAPEVLLINDHREGSFA